LPKTGGSWVVKCLEDSGIDFYEIDPEHKCNGGHTGYYYKCQNGFSFSFIRNPFDWYKSLFKFNVGSNRHPDWEKEDINKFVFETIQSGHSLAEMSRYYFGNNYEISFIGKYENLCEGLIEALNFALENRSGQDEERIRKFSEVLINSTEKVGCNEYTTETKNIIYAADSYIFRRFKY
jgi:hypothetical protein